MIFASICVQMSMWTEEEQVCNDTLVQNAFCIEMTEQEQRAKQWRRIRRGWGGQGLQLWVESKSQLFPTQGLACQDHPKGVRKVDTQAGKGFKVQDPDVSSLKWPNWLKTSLLVAGALLVRFSKRKWVVEPDWGLSHVNSYWKGHLQWKGSDINPNWVTQGL